MITYSKDMYHRKSKHTDKLNVSLKKELKPGKGNIPRVPISNITQKSCYVNKTSIGEEGWCKLKWNKVSNCQSQHNPICLKYNSKFMFKPLAYISSL